MQKLLKTMTILQAIGGLAFLLFLVVAGALGAGKKGEANMEKTFEDELNRLKRNN